MLPDIIGINLTNIDTGESLYQYVHTCDLRVPQQAEVLQKVLSRFVSVVRSNCNGDSHDTFCLELRSYRSHKQLELPF